MLTLFRSTAPSRPHSTTVSRPVHCFRKRISKPRASLYDQTAGRSVLKRIGILLKIEPTIPEVYVTLKQLLDERRATSAKNAPPARSAAFQRGVDQLIADGIAQNAVKEGDIAPDFQLPDARGIQVSLYERLSRGAVVLTFYRGGWCPYCNLQLRAYQAILPELQTLDTSLIAISPERPDDSLSTIEKNELDFDVLSDINGDAGRAYRVTFELSDELKAVYTEIGNDLAKRNADGEWHLPLPATYVIAPDKRVTFAFVDADYRNRLEPTDIVTAVRTLATTLA